MPNGSSDGGGVERPDPDRGLHHSDRDGVVEQRLRAEAARLQPLDHERLDRDAVDVGVQPDVAVEDAVGVRDRLGAEGDRLAAPEAAREVAQARLDARRAGRGRRLDLDVPQPQLRELRGELRGDPAEGGLVLDHRRIASTRRASSASGAPPSVVCDTSPPARANVIVGQTAIA